MIKISVTLHFLLKNHVLPFYFLAHHMEAKTISDQKKILFEAHRKESLSLSEVMTILVLFHVAGYRNLK